MNHLANKLEVRWLRTASRVIRNLCIDIHTETAIFPAEQSSQTTCSAYSIKTNFRLLHQNGLDVTGLLTRNLYGSMRMRCPVLWTGGACGQRTKRNCRTKTTHLLHTRFRLGLVLDMDGSIHRSDRIGLGRITVNPVFSEEFNITSTSTDRNDMANANPLFVIRNTRCLQPELLIIAV